MSENLDAAHLHPESSRPLIFSLEETLSARTRTYHRSFPGYVIVTPLIHQHRGVCITFLTVFLAQGFFMKYLKDHLD